MNLAINGFDLNLYLKRKKFYSQKHYREYKYKRDGESGCYPAADHFIYRALWRRNARVLGQLLSVTIGFTNAWHL